MRAPPNIGNINQYHQHFRSAAQGIRAEPRVDRNCNDKCCYVFFIIITLVFIGTGAYYMSQANFNDAYNKYSSNESFSDSQQYEGSMIQVENLKGSIPIIAGLIIFAMVLAIAFMLLIVKFPRPMFYGMIILTTLIILVGIIISIIFKMYAFTVGLVIMVMIYACVLYCIRDKIDDGIIVMQVACAFLTHKPSIFLAPIFMMIFVIVFEVFWLGGLLGLSLMQIQAETEQQVKTQQNIRSSTIIFWMIFQIFYSTFFYYCLVFIIATGCAMWYYSVQEGFYLFKAVQRIIKYHIGSFTFATTLVTIVTMARQSAEQQSRESSGACFLCFCCLTCFLKIIEDLLEVLNHNAIIVMAVTGQSYIDSAKSTISLIFQNFSLFIVVDIISGIIKFTGSLLICGIPSLLGFFLIRAGLENPDDKFVLTVGVISIVLASLLIGGLVLGMIGEAINCIYIFYCLDIKFQAMGFDVVNSVPPEMRKMLNQIQHQHNNQYNYGNNNQNGYNNAFDGGNDYNNAGNGYNNNRGYDQNNSSNPYYDPNNNNSWGGPKY